MQQKPLVTIYTKPGCQLCEEAKDVILRSECAGECELEIVNIASNEELFVRYQYDIPVIFINGVKAFKHRLSSREFCQRLRRAAKKAR
jgi:glutaredoxin